MSLTSIAQYTALAYRQIFSLAQKVKGVRYRTVATPLLTNKHILLLVRADNEPIAETLSAKLKDLGGKVKLKYFSAISHESKLLENISFSSVFTIGCSHSTTLEIAERSHAPVINVCSSKHSPVHVLADIFSVYEKHGFNFKDVSFCWHGLSENSAHSWLEAANVLGFKLSVVPTPTMHLDPDILSSCQQCNHERIFLSKSLTDADVTINETTGPNSKRLSLSRKVGDSLSNRSKGRDVTGDGVEFWDNELCILLAMMIWAQE